MAKRSVFCEIAGRKFELIFSVAARMWMNEKYGSVGGFYEKMKSVENENDLFVMIAETFAKLANQGVALHKIKNSECNEKEVKVDDLFVMMTGGDLFDVQTKVIESITNGSARYVESEEDEKN